ncbi:MAG: branched-chain amino acid ABC transporter permease [Proteobacteria bacterium]|nr:branched-chain amino acid ABC transporter permease [Pseudomonadota bacterium]
MQKYFDIEFWRRVTYVDVTLWLMRAAVIIVVVWGTIGTLIDGRYSNEQWFDFVMFGLTMGGIYALVALGYTMVYGILRLINFAHGDIFMTGAFTAYFVASPLGKSGFLEENLLISMIIICLTAMVTCVIIALTVERICYRPFRSVRSFAPLICAIGASFFIQHSFRGMYGSSVRAYPDVEFFDKLLSIGSFDFPMIQPVVILAALGSMTGLYLIVMKTRMGTAMRATSEDRDTASLMGIDVNRVIIFTFVLGGSMAGIGGVLYAFVFKQVYFFMGFFPGIKAFSAAVLGGIGNIPGAMLGGFFLGTVESVGPALFLDGLGIVAPYQLRDLIAFTMLVMVLIFRPQGLLGERVSQRA